MSFDRIDEPPFDALPAALQAFAWRGCDPAPGRPAWRFGVGLFFTALMLISIGALLQAPLPLQPGLPLLSLACALSAALLLFMPTRRLCRVVVQPRGIDVVWRVARNGFSPAGFLTDHRGWDEVRALEKVHTADDGESGEKWEIRIEVTGKLLDGRALVTLSFADEAQLDAWLARARRSREQRDAGV